MKFYDATKATNGLCQEVDRLCDTTDNSYPRLDKTARINNALEELVGKIISSDGVWEWDDTNQTDLPVSTGTLVEGQESYSFAAEYLKVKRVKIKDLNGNWFLLKQIDQQDLEASGTAIESLFGISSGNPQTGLPQYYDILGDSIRLYPAPTSANVTLASGIKADFVRTAVLFTATSATTADTTEPGLPSPYHVLLAYKASLPYCASHKKDRVGWLTSEIARLEDSLIKFYAKRNPNRKNRITMLQTNFR
jgi:hypothetical protein